MVCTPLWAKAWLPMDCTPSGKSTWAMQLLPKKACSSISVIITGSVSVVSASPMVLTIRMQIPRIKKILHSFFPIGRPPLP